MKQYIFFFIAFGFLLGVLFSSFFEATFSFLIFSFTVFVCVFIYLISRYLIRHKKEKVKWITLLFVGVCSFYFGMSRFVYRDNTLDTSDLKQYDGKTIALVGIVLDEPSRKNDNISFRVKAYSLSDRGKVLDIRPEFVSVRVSYLNEISYGDAVVVSGKISKFKNFQNELGAPFDYVSYQKVFGVSREIVFPKVEVVGHQKGNPAIAFFLSLKHKFISNIDNSLGEPDAALVSGMVISGKGSLEKDLQNDFIKAGIIHIIVLSGYNIALVISFLIFIFRFTGRSIRLFIISFGVLIFVIISGGSPPVVRAAIMAIAILVLKISGREGLAFRILVFTAFIMVLQNPYLLAFSSSFALSFLAFFSVIFISPILKTRLSFITEKYKLREIVSDTLGVQIFLSPYLVYKMGLVSLVALPVNILVLPIVPYIMFLGFIVGVFAFIPYITFPFTVLAHFLIKYMLFVVDTFIAIPYASLSVSHISIYFVLLLYGVMFWYIILKHKKSIS